MAKAYTDDEELINFSNALESYLNTLSEETNKLNSAFQTLGETWQDQQRQSFEENFKQLLGALSNFKDNASEQIPYLRTMAEDIRTYLHR